MTLTRIGNNINERHWAYTKVSFLISYVYAIHISHDWKSYITPLKLTKSNEKTEDTKNTHLKIKPCTTLVTNTLSGRTVSHKKQTDLDYHVSKPKKHTMFLYMKTEQRLGCARHPQATASMQIYATLIASITTVYYYDNRTRNFNFSP